MLLVSAASIAAYGCLRAMNTLMESVSGLGPQLYPVFEDALLPLMQKYLSTDGQDIIEEVRAEEQGTHGVSSVEGLLCRTPLELCARCCCAALQVLEMLAYLTYFNTSISPRVWALWPQLHQVG